MLNLEQQIFKQIEQAKDILVVFPKDQDGDTIASSLALFNFFKNLKKSCSVAGALKEENKNFSFLPSYHEISSSLINLRRFIVSLDISSTKVNQIKYTVDANRLDFIISPSAGWFKPEDVSARAGEFKYDLIITLGVLELESLGSLYDENIEFFYKTTIINVDNGAANEDFGQINFIDLNAASISEMIFYLLKNYQPNLLDEQVATCLLAGIIQKTKNFKSSNLTPRTLLASSELISYQADREKIINNLYRSRDIKTLRLWGKFLSSLRSEMDDQFLWSKITAEQLNNEGLSIKNLDDIIDELIVTVPKANLVTIFYQTEPSTTQIILYSLKNIDALSMLASYLPTGNRRTASISLKGDYDTVSSMILPEIKNQLEKIKL